MASPAAEALPNGISTPPTTANVQNPSPPTASSTVPNTQTSQPPASQPNGTSTALPANPSFPTTSLQDTGTARRPRDARLIHLLLANMGVRAYTDRVPLQLLDFAYRYTSGILSDALSYEPAPPSAHQSSHAAKKAAKQSGGGAGADDADGISLNALRTAIAARAAQQFNPVLPKDFMAEVAGERNRVALPRVEREFGVRLPPERYCFTGVGWGIKEAWEEEEDEDLVGEEEGEGDALAGSASGGVGVGGPVGGAATDTAMGGMGDEEVDEDEFEEAFGGGGGDADMADG